ncbi:MULTISPECIES: hypothetical protein [unclassified Imperialibacter]|uniref:hypothetical protein n=1 Tax=unclassified Imperialibacter TaxID=2629706 RepID=UPI0012517B41|nr:MULTISPECIES: hypothetical protein [unclassified Imperialibacter]CAD5279938.1 conserved hypothetical protein [Imperialibacter sp. 75]CAD5281257.1 conserved hypothetical protein [Imperialibacter sp. 89]VVT31956.1 conserved hypothetical protein [Imperialibacter sp. EC-SDR9]
MLLFGLVVLATGIVGLLISLTFASIAVFKKGAKNWRRSGIAFLTTLAVTLCLILVQELVIYPPNPKLERLILSAYREAPIGGIWLGIYDDNTWQLGYSSKEITSEGTYRFSGDTLLLVADNGAKVIGDFDQTAFIIKANQLVELNNSGIRSLEILQNRLNEKKL